jgi:OmpA-OmpF porin, OOP family
MTRRTGTRRLLSGLAVAVTAATVTGCHHPEPSPDPAPAGSCATTGNLALAVGARANSPAPVRDEGGRPELPRTVEDLLVGVAQRGGQLSVVRVDGRPASVLTDAFETDGKTEVKQGVDRRRWLSRMRTAIGGVRATAPEADVLAALTLAAREARPGGTVVLQDSGLQTLDPLDFRQQLLTAEPTELVAYLRSRRLLPDLAGRTLVLVGVGDTVAPQLPLDEAQRHTLVDLWSAVGKAAGACVTVSDEVSSVAAVTGVPAVSPVPVARTRTPDVRPCRDTVLPDSGTVGFVPDRAVYRDPAGARRTLQGIATQIVEGDLAVSLIGTTATSGSEAGRIALSRQRADQVRVTLVELGVPPARIVEVRGVGTHWRTHVPDLAPDGRTLLPGPAAANRSVVIRAGCG